jgi:hypothetical protein
VTAALLALLLVHESSVSSSRLELDGREIRATFTFSLEDLAGLARLDLNRDGRVDSDEWTQVLPAIFAYVGEKFRIEGFRSEGDLRRVPPSLLMADGRAPVTLALVYRAFRPMEKLSIGCDLFTEHGGNPRHVAELAGGRTIVFDKDRREVDEVLKTTTRRGSVGRGGAIAAGLGAAVLCPALVQRFRARGRRRT